MNKRFVKFLVSALIVVAIPMQAFGYDYIYSKKYNYATDNNGKPLNGWQYFTLDERKWSPKFKEGFDKDANAVNYSLPFFTDWVYFENGKFKTGWFKSADGNWYYLSGKNGSIVRDDFVDGYYLNKNGVMSSTVPADSKTNYYTLAEVKATVTKANQLISTGKWERRASQVNICGERYLLPMSGYRTSLGYTGTVQKNTDMGYPLAVGCDIDAGVATVEVYVSPNRSFKDRQAVKISPEKFDELFNANKFLYFNVESTMGGGASGDSASTYKYSSPFVTDASILK